MALNTANSTADRRRSKHRAARKYDALVRSAFTRYEVRRAKFAVGQLVSYKSKLYDIAGIGTVSKVGRGYGIMYELKELEDIYAFQETELKAIEMLPETTSEQHTAILQVVGVQSSAARLWKQIWLVWLISTRKRNNKPNRIINVDHYVGLTPRYYLWRLIVESQAVIAMPVEAGLQVAA